MFPLSPSKQEGDNCADNTMFAALAPSEWQTIIRSIHNSSPSSCAKGRPGRLHHPLMLTDRRCLGLPDGSSAGLCGCTNSLPEYNSTAFKVGPNYHHRSAGAGATGLDRAGDAARSGKSPTT